MGSATLGIITELSGMKVEASVLVVLVGTVGALLRRGADVALDAFRGKVVVLLGNEAAKFRSGGVFTGCLGRG